MTSRLTQSRIKIEEALQQVSPEVKALFLQAIALSNPKLKELRELLGLLDKYRQEHGKFDTIGYIEGGFFSRAHLHQQQWVNFLVSCLDGKPDRDLAPYQRCWWCGVPIEGRNRHYHDDECQIAANNWKKYVRKKASAIQNPLKKSEFYTSAAIQSIQKRNPQPFVPTLNMGFALESQGEAETQSN